jgi:hypothetical protein
MTDPPVDAIETLCINTVELPLNSAILRKIADTGLDVVPRSARRPYVADDFRLLLTVTNLRGMPYYSIPTAIAPSHGMSLGRTEGWTSRMGTSACSPSVPP